MKIRVRSTLIFASYAMLVAFASLRQGSGSFIGSYDKLAHFLTYSLFAVLAYRLFLSASQYRYLCLGIIAYSGLLEIAQSFVPGRDMSVLDLVANALGVILGALLCEKIFGTRSMSSTTDE